LTRHFDIDLPAASAGAGGAKRDTSELCRQRAAADLLQSATMINANQRIRLETSSTTWALRADMLQRVEDNFAKRLAEAAAAGHDASAEPTRL
jgi:hypothetical protein